MDNLNTTWQQKNFIPKEVLQRSIGRIYTVFESERMSRNDERIF